MLNFDNPPEYALNLNPSTPTPNYHSFDPIEGRFSRQGQILIANLIIQPIAYRWDYRNKIRFDLLFVDKLSQPGWICLGEGDALEILETLKELERSNINICSVFLCLGKTREFGLYRPIVASFYWASLYQTCFGSHFLTSLQRNPWEALK